MSDEEQIRELIRRWIDATQAGDIDAALDLMTDDAVFLVVGREPFGKEAFRKAAESMKSGPAQVRMEGESAIEEVKVLGDWAYVRSRLKVTATPAGGSPPVHRAGHTLSIFRKEADGKWRLSRDANLLSVVD